MDMLSPYTDSLLRVCSTTFRSRWLITLTKISSGNTILYNILRKGDDRGFTIMIHRRCNYVNHNNGLKPLKYLAFWQVIAGY